MHERCYDVAIVGGGIVGLSTALALVEQAAASLIVVEAEGKLASHQTGHNSGVIHSGIYYRPGSLKARNCTAGRDALYEFCRQHGIAHERCGKLIVATRPAELPALAALEQRAVDNGLQGVRRVSPDEARELEPHVAAIAGLHVPQTGIVDYVSVANKYAELAAARGADLRTTARVVAVRTSADYLTLETTAGAFHCRNVINCAGLQSDRVARMCGVDPQVRIVPFRGEYYELVPERVGLVRNLVYPVPDPALPFLGVHFTRMIGGGVEAGPNAVLALSRHGYRRGSVSPRDLGSMLAFPGFWRMAARHWRMAVAEYWRSLGKRAYVRELRRLLPEIRGSDVVRAGSGVRAQAVARNGALVDDFSIQHAERMIHVLNAPSPAATASLAIGRSIAALACDRFGLVSR